MSTEATHRIVHSTDDYSVFQINLLLSHLNLGDRVSTHFDATLDESTKGVQLHTPEASIAPRNAVFKHLASITDDASWLGKSDEERSQIDHWTDFAWHRLGDFLFMHTFHPQTNQNDFI